MRCVLCSTTSWLPVYLFSPRNSSKRLSLGMLLAVGFTLGIDGGSMRPGVDS